MQMSLFLRASATILVISSFVDSGLGSGGPVSFCQTGNFRHPLTGQCQACTRPCPSPLVEIRECRPDGDTVCGGSPPDTHAIVRRKTRKRLCPADAFFNDDTGGCQECVRFCAPPLRMVSPCTQESDTKCGLKPVDTKKHRRNKETTRSHRRKASRERRRKYGQKKPNAKKSPQYCSVDGSQFYDRERGRCVRCRSCDGPGLAESSPCTATSDRVCRLPAAQIDGALGDVFPEFGSNEFPQDVGPTHRQAGNGLLSNEYPESPRIRIDTVHAPPERADNSPKNVVIGEEKISLDFVLSNSAETRQLKTARPHDI